MAVVGQTSRLTSKAYIYWDRRPIWPLKVNVLYLYLQENCVLYGSWNFFFDGILFYWNIHNNQSSHKMFMLNLSLDTTAPIYKAVCWAVTVKRSRLTVMHRSSTWLQPGWPGFDPQQRQRFLPLAFVFTPSLGSTQPLIFNGYWVLSLRIQHGRGMTLTLLVPRSRTGRSLHPIPVDACMALQNSFILIYRSIEFVRTNVERPRT
jgi:hypothetical protein